MFRVHETRAFSCVFQKWNAKEKALVFVLVVCYTEVEYSFYLICMSPEQIVEMVKNDQIDPQWVIFRYNKVRSLLVLLYKIFFTGIFLGPAIILWTASARPLVSDTKVVMYGMGIVGLGALLVLLRHIYTLFFLQSNMIVLTTEGVMKSIRGKQFFWSYANIQELRQLVTQTKNSMPTYSVEFRDAETGKVFELCRGHEFNSAQTIFAALQNKISLL